MVTTNSKGPAVLVRYKRHSYYAYNKNINEIVGKLHSIRVDKEIER